MTNVETALNFISVIADITSAADEMFSTEISESIQVIADEEPDSTELAGTSEAASKGTTMLTRPSTGTIQRNQSSRIFIKRNRPFQITECPSLISEGKEKPHQMRLQSRMQKRSHLIEYSNSTPQRHRLKGGEASGYENSSW